MGTIASGQQTRQKDCLATSSRVKLTLRTNGEMLNTVISPAGFSPVQAGFDAPTVAPSRTTTTPGSLSGYYIYCYVYASTKFPYVENAVSTADGELWPRSNPSPPCTAIYTSGFFGVILTLTKSTQPGIDKILIYRTRSAATGVEAQALADAGTYYYVGQVDNNGVAGTVTYTDIYSGDTNEPVELDNYVADTAQFCVFDGTYWWAGGNPEVSASVVLDGTENIEITDEQWFSGRNGQVITFDGVSTGGFGSVGSFYLKVTGPRTGTLYLDQDLTTATIVSYGGTTTCNVVGFTNVLYRSKPFNPFSWGFTETVVNNDQSTTNVPQSFALNLGGGNITAMAVSPNGKRLKIDFVNPQRTIALDLEFADSENFGNTQVILDNTASVTANFSQFNGFIGDKPMLLGLDTYNGEILASDGYQQVAIDDNLGVFLQGLPKPDRGNFFIHGQYDPGTQLNCWWMRLYDTDVRNNIMVWMHAPTQMWGWTPDYDILCSGTVLDSETNERFLVGGTELGFMGRLLDGATFSNWFGNSLCLLDVFQTDAIPVSATQVALTPFSSGIQILSSNINASAGTFTTSELNFVVGQSIYLKEIGETAQYFTVSSITLNDNATWTVTVSGPITIAQDLNFTTGPAFRYYGNTWAVFTFFDEASTPAPISNAWFAKLEWNSFTDQFNLQSIFDVSYYAAVGDETLTTPTSLPWSSSEFDQYAYGGGAPCLYRSYFDLNSPTIAKRTYESWFTANPSDSGTGTDYSTYLFTTPFMRFYHQFDNDWASEISMHRDADIPANEKSIVWLNRNDVPSTLLKQFGVEICEIGQTDWQLFNYTVKVQEAG